MLSPEMEGNKAKLEPGGAEVKVEPVDEETASGALEDSLKKLLQGKGVSSETIRNLGLARCKTIGVFSSVVDSRSQLREFAAKSLNLKTPAEAMEVAALIGAWETARIIAEQKRQREAQELLAGGSEADTKSGGKWQECREQFERACHKLEAAQSPAEETLDHLQRQVEAAKFTAKPLRHFLSEADPGPQPIQTAIGAVRVRRGVRQAEEVIARLRIMACALVMVGMQAKQHGVLQRLVLDDFAFIGRRWERRPRTQVTGGRGRSKA